MFFVVQVDYDIIFEVNHDHTMLFVVDVDYVLVVEVNLDQTI